MSTISPSQERVALTKANTARKAIRLAATLATRPMASVAPLLAASRIFLSSLWLLGTEEEYATDSGLISSERRSSRDPKVEEVGSQPLGGVKGFFSNYNSGDCSLVIQMLLP